VADAARHGYCPELFKAVSVKIAIFWVLAHVDADLLKEHAASTTVLRHKYFQPGLMSFWTSSIVQDSKEHNVSETGSVSFLW
jgi:hypothetical protein